MSENNVNEYNSKGYDKDGYDKEGRPRWLINKVSKTRYTKCNYIC